MGELGAGRELAELRSRIRALRSEVESMGEDRGDLPGMIDSANLLRKSEHLARSDALKTDLIECYREYAEGLEGLLRSVLEIQSELTGVLHDQSRMIRAGRRPGAGR